MTEPREEYVTRDMDTADDIDGSLHCEHGTLLDLKTPALFILYSLSRTYNKTHNKRLKVSSGYRCKECNARAGGAAKSAHLRGEAFDVHYDNGHECYTILKFLLSNGVSIHRLGVGGTFIHFDIGSADEGYIQDTVWTY